MRGGAEAGNSTTLKMPTIAIQLDPALLDNPDLDIRYELPDLLAERSNGLIRDMGYDYVHDSQLLALFLETTDVEAALVQILEVINNVRLLENDLRSGTVVGVLRDNRYDVVYPPSFAGEFHVPAAE